MAISIAVIVGIILAIGATVVLCILVMPEKRKDRLNKFFTVVRDIFNFKTLYIEKILKILYIFNTLVCILIGFFLLFSWERYSFFGYSRSTWYGWIGLLVMILGPVIVRIIYEYSLLLVIGVSKLMSIDNKIPADGCCKTDETVKETEPAPAPAPAPVSDPTPAWKPAEGVTPPWVHTAETAAPAEPVPEPAPEPEPVYRYCAYCGTKYDTNKGGCPNCGR